MRACSPFISVPFFLRALAWAVTSVTAAAKPRRGRAIKKGCAVKPELHPETPGCWTPLPGLGTPFLPARKPRLDLFSCSGFSSCYPGDTEAWKIKLFNA